MPTQQLAKRWWLASIGAAAVIVIRLALVGAGPGRGSLYATDAMDGNLLIVDAAGGGGAVVGPFTDGPMRALSTDPATGVMYAAKEGAPSLYRVDPLTAATTHVGDAGIGAAAIQGLDFNDLAVLYASLDLTGAGSGGDHLAILDKKTGAATLVGSFGSCAAGACTIDGIEGLAFDRTGELWGTHRSLAGAGAPGLYRIDVSTGAATFVAPFLNAGDGQPPSGGITSLRFDCAGTLYGSTGQAVGGAADGGRLVTIDPSGAFQIVGPSPAVSGSDLSGLTFSQYCGHVVENAFSGFPISIDGQFTGGIAATPSGRSVVGEWSEVRPLGFVSPVQQGLPLHRSALTDPRVNSLLYAGVAPDTADGKARALSLLFDYLPRTQCAFIPGEPIADVTVPLLYGGVTGPVTLQVRGAASSGQTVGGCGSDSWFQLAVDLNGDTVPDTSGAALGITAAVGFGQSTLSLTPHLLVEMQVPLMVPAGFGSVFPAEGLPAGVYAPAPAPWNASLANDVVDPAAAAAWIEVHADGSIDASSTGTPEAPANLPPSVHFVSSHVPPVIHVHDGDGDALTVTWFVDGNPVSTHAVSGGAPPAAADLTLSHVFTGGTHTVRVDVTDGKAAPVSSSVDLALPGLSINIVELAEGQSGTVDAVFRVQLSSASALAVTVGYATNDRTAISGADFQSQAGILTFPPGVTQQTVTVQVNGDALYETDEFFDVMLGTPTNAGIDSARGFARIFNDDAPPSLSIAGVTMAEGNSDGTAVFNLALSSASGLDVTVNFATRDGSAAAPSDYTSNSGVVRFLPGTTQQNVTVVIRGDGVVEPDESFFVDFSALNGATLAPGSALSAVGALLNDDAFPVVTGRSPIPGATATSVLPSVQATFSQPMNPAFLNGSTFKLLLPAVTANVIRFDEVPAFELDGRTFNGVTFGFTLNGVPHHDAHFNSVSGPDEIGDSTLYLDLHTIEGNAAGVLTMDFATPIRFLRFGAALDTDDPVSPGFQVQLFDPSLSPLPVQSIDAAPQPGYLFAEAQFTHSGAAVSRVVITFDSTTGDCSSFGNPQRCVGGRFALDDLTFAAVPSPTLPGSPGVPSEVSGTIGYSGLTATFTPNAPLASFTTYLARVKGGPDGVRDAAGNAMAGDADWAFTTGEPDSRIIIVNQTNPAAGAPAFMFSASYLPAPFSLVDSESLETGGLPPGVFSVSESVPAGWDLLSATCSDGSPVTAISLEDDETVTCTFTNRKQARIVVMKETVPAGDPTSFSFAASYLAPIAAPSFRAQSSRTATSANVIFNKPSGAAAGDVLLAFLTWNNSVNLSSPPAGWTQIGSSLVSGAIEFQAWYYVVRPSDASVTSWTWRLNTSVKWFSIGGAYRGVDTNAAVDGFSTATQVAGATISAPSLPLGAANDLVVVFNDTNGSGSWTPPAGFVERQETDGQAIADRLFADAGPSGPQTSTLSTSGNSKTMWMVALRRAGVFTLADAQLHDSGPLLPGTYAVAEIVPAGWELVGTACSDGSPVSAISLQETETVTCTFTNGKRPQIVVVNRTEPPGDPTVFGYVASYLPPPVDPTFRSQTNRTGNSSNVVFTKPSGASAGDVLLTFLTWNNSLDLATAPPGWAQIGSPFVSGSLEFQAWYRTVTADDSSVASWTWRLTGATTWFTIGGAYRGVSVLSPIDTFSTATQLTGNTIATAPAILGAPRDLVVVFNDRGGSGSWTPPAGFAERVEVNGQSLNDRLFVTEGSIGEQLSTLTTAGTRKTSLMVALRRNTGLALSDGQSSDSGPLAPGVYSLSEIVPPGWTLAGATCSDGSPVDAISLEIAELVTCTFQNVKDLP